MTDIVIQPGELYKLEALTDRDHFLTARYRLYTLTRRRVAHAQIEHPRWLLAQARVIELRQTLFDHSHLPPPQGEPLVHYAAELSVKIGPLELH